MNVNIKVSIVIGLIIGTMLFPMIIIPLMFIGVVGWALVLLGRIVMNKLGDQNDN